MEGGRKWRGVKLGNSAYTQVSHSLQAVLQNLQLVFLRLLSCVRVLQLSGRSTLSMQRLIQLCLRLIQLCLVRRIIGNR